MVHKESKHCERLLAKLDEILESRQAASRIYHQPAKVEEMKKLVRELCQDDNKDDATRIAELVIQVVQDEPPEES